MSDHGSGNGRIVPAEYALRGRVVPGVYTTQMRNGTYMNCFRCFQYNLRVAALNQECLVSKSFRLETHTMKRFQWPVPSYPRNCDTVHKKLKDLHRQINLGYVVDAEGMACRACSADFLGKIQWSCCLICQRQGRLQLQWPTSARCENMVLDSNEPTGTEMSKMAE